MDHCHPFKRELSFLFFFLIIVLCTFHVWIGIIWAGMGFLVEAVGMKIYHNSHGLMLVRSQILLK